MSLEIKELKVSTNNKEILKGISLTIPKGEIHALLGPNGSGKSTLANTLMGHPNYKITSGKIILNGKDITNLPAHERAKAGLFLSFQYPKTIPGLKMSNFMRGAYNSIKKEIKPLKFQKILKQKMEQLQIEPEFAKRNLNEGFSGGEKKKAEILQMSILDPKYIILDETDSGLDIDALRIVGEGIKKIKENKSFLIITHYMKIFEYLKPNKVYIIKSGKIIKEGPPSILKEISTKGFQ